MATTKQKRKTSAVSRPKAKFSKKKAASSNRTTDLRGKDLERAVEQVQAEPDDKRAHEQWKQVESLIVGVHFRD
jgi:hypothetical protein